MPAEAPNPPPQKASDRGWRAVLAGIRDPAWWAQRKALAALLAAILVVAAVAAVAAYNSVKRPADVLNTEAAFNPQETETKERRTNWPLYGFDRARTRYLAAKGIKPPFRRLWKYGGRPLLEFPPIYVNGELYGLDNNGHVFAIDADNGRVLWKRRIGTKNASAPAYARKRIFVVNLAPGQVRALNVKNGRTEWRKELGSRSESSPVVVGNRVFFGDEGGSLYAVDRRNGRTIWTSQLCGAIKAAPAYERGTLYVGDYGGCMNAVNARNGKIRWQSSSQGLSFSRTGAFYSTPAVAFGRVYSGNNDGRVYSYEARDGTLAWSHSTGGYVYSGPAVADTPNTGPSVYIGSIDGNVYALNAKTGELRWSRHAGGQIISAVSAVGNIVYVPTYDPKATTGYTMRDGRKVFSYETGGANSPVISDGQRIFLTGYSSITGLEPARKSARGGRESRGRRDAASPRGRDRSRSERSKRRAQRQRRRR